MGSFEESADEGKDWIWVQIEESIDVKLTSNLSIDEKIASDLLTVEESVVKHVEDNLLVAVGVTTHH